MECSHVHKQEACCSVGLNMYCLASMVEKINIPVFQVSLPFQHGPLQLASSYIPDLLLLFGTCGSWGFWTLRCLDLNPEHLQSWEERTSERRVLGSQRRIGEVRNVFPKHRLERGSPPARGRGRSEQAWVALLPGRES